MMRKEMAASSGTLVFIFSAAITGNWVACLLLMPRVVLVSFLGLPGASCCLEIAWFSKVAAGQKSKFLAVCCKKKSYDINFLGFLPSLGVI